MINTALAILQTDEQRNTLSDFYQTYKNRFYAIAYSKLHDRNLAEDAVQEAFSELHLNQKHFFLSAITIAYTDVIIRNVSVDMFRNCVMNAPEELPEYDENIPLLEDIIVGSLQKQRLMDFIVGLPQLQRDIMELRISFGMSNSEIANQLKISENVVRQRLYQSRKAITEFLKKENRNESI